jgi:hypothetical protein
VIHYLFVLSLHRLFNWAYQTRDYGKPIEL